MEARSLGECLLSHFFQWNMFSSAALLQGCLPLAFEAPQPSVARRRAEAESSLNGCACDIQFLGHLVAPLDAVSNRRSNRLRPDLGFHPSLQIVLGGEAARSLKPSCTLFGARAEQGCELLLRSVQKLVAHPLCEIIRRVAHLLLFQELGRPSRSPAQAWQAW